MAVSIFRAGAGLFAAFSLIYLVTWSSSSGDLGQAQTAAFVAWLLGHVLLALILRSEREPLFRLGFFSNRLRILWAGLAIALALFADPVLGVRALLKTTSLSGLNWLMLMVARVLGTFWIEIVKTVFWQGHSQKITA